jgi:hypothetical protein
VSGHDNAEPVQSDVAPAEDALPGSIRTLLDEWYVGRGSQCPPPPCALGEAIKGKSGGIDQTGFPYYVLEGVRGRDPNISEEESSIMKYFKSPKEAMTFHFAPERVLVQGPAAVSIRMLETLQLCTVRNGNVCDRRTKAVTQ